MKFPARGLALLALASCASGPRSIVDEVNEGNISTQTVLDLARSSYLKGCVDGKNAFLPESGESAFVKCREMAKDHESEINYILQQNPAPKKSE